MITSKDTLLVMSVVAEESCVFFFLFLRWQQENSRGRVNLKILTMRILTGNMMREL